MFIVKTEDNWFLAIHPKANCPFLANDNMEIKPIIYTEIQNAKKCIKDFREFQNANESLILKVIEYKEI
jgi:hypothetical protein